MKIWVPVFLCFFSVKAFASSADSGRCPWNLPFTITVHAMGTTTRNDIYSEPHGGSTETWSPTLDSENIEFTIDTTIFSSLGKGDEYVTTQLTTSRDTLWYSYSYTDTSFAPFLRNQSTSVIIAFVPHKDSILSLTCTFGNGNSYGPTENSDQYSLFLSSLAFDDTSIYCSDSVGNHIAQFEVRHATDDYPYPNNTEFGSFDNTNFTASTICLSRNFRPTFFVVDSTVQPCPLHQPFQIIANARGTEDSSGQSVPSSQDYSWSISNAPMINDVVQIGDSFFGRAGPSGVITRTSSLDIHFIHGTDSISSITIDSNFESSFPFNPSDAEYRWFTFQISSLAFDSMMIFTSDSSFCVHNTLLSWGDSNQSGSTRFTATSAILSGIFRPTNYTCAESVPELIPISNSLKVYSSSSSIQCSFDALDGPRRLDVYSILGSKAARIEIAGGAKEAMFRNLPPGFYFVRLGNEVAKAIIP
jgi:hypothetical protein